MNKLFTAMLICFTAGLILTGCTSQTNTASPEMPNPCLTATGTNEIFFNDLAATCTIEIYTVAGELVRTLSIFNGNGQTSWDLKNAAGELLLSGTYGYLIKNSTTQKTGKVVIIR